MEKQSTGNSPVKSNMIHNCDTKFDLADTSWEISMRKKVRGSHPNCSALSSCDKNKTATIFRVPDNIRACDPEAYEPLVVTLGPFKNETYRCPCSIEAMQKHKYRCVLFLLSRHLDQDMANKMLGKCLAAVKALEICARRCYMGDASLEALSSDEFAEMLLLDGCFILHLLLKHGERSEIQVIVEKQESMVFLVEEEILQTKSYEFKESPDENDEERKRGRRRRQYGEQEEEVVLLQCSQDDEMLSVGGLWTWSFVKYDLLKLENQIPFFVVQTLFDLMKTPMDGDTDLVRLALKFFQGFHPRRTGPSITIPSSQVHHLLHLYHLSLLPSSERRAMPSSQSREWIPSATELRESGIGFKKKPDAHSCLDITFANGVIEIPTLHLCKYSSTVFRNLMAFEQCFPVSPYVTNYALFMDCILHSGAKDVRLLHLKGIILNRQSSDEEAARFFNDLSRQIHHGYESDYLGDVFQEVMKYTEIRWNRWRAGLVREYFRSPWTIISITAAIFLLVMTIEQAFFSAYSYFLPPR